jgi:CO dehydrogenase/acetyl-CoA synthase beta subunit
MELFERTIIDIRNDIQKKKYVELSALQDTGNWPGGAGRNVVLTEDMAVELGNPQKDSSSSLLWTQHADMISDGKITLIGPDIPSSIGLSLPFGKVVLVAVNGFNEDNTYDRYKEMEAVRYALDLKGYMIRAVSQYQREWSRISREAVQKGFSFKVLGSELRKEYLKKDYIRAVEFIFMTSSMEDVRELKDITKNVGRTINALDKMLNEIEADCDECEYNDVCDEVGEIKKVKKNRDEKRMKANG